MNLPTLRQLAGNAVVAAHLRGQRALPYAPPDELRDARDRRARAIARWAAAHVPHYRDLFAARRIDPRDVRRAEDLRALPPVTKAQLRAAPERFVATDGRRGRGALRFVTSGTTGERTTVLHDRVSLLANVAWGERERAALRAMLGDAPSRREVLVVHRGSTVLQVWDFYARHTWIPARAERLTLHVETPLEDVVARIAAFRPDVLMGYGSYLELLFRVAAERGWIVPRPRAVVYGADALSSSGRRFLEHDLGIRVLSTYSAVEAFKIGFTCEAGERFHLHDDLCHVRLVDRAGRDVAVGESGEVSISNLVNRGTVLLNYRLGDVATWAPGACACGRTLPALATLHGRDEDVLELAGGHLLHPRSIWNLVKQRPEVLRFQVVQQARDRLELRLMTADRAAYDRLVTGLTTELRALAGDVDVAPVFAAELDARIAGKFRAVVGLPRGTA